ncbi:ATP-binding protein [Actinophytocola sp.]|uniref:ATP-binding protein n=1 Tax=Actinophytocola sp. TaxID=1872138 RepID=UPI00389A483C
MITQRLRTNAGDLADRLADLVGQLAEDGGLCSRRAYRLRLAADEITTNIAVHGYRGRAGTVDVFGGVEPDRVWLRIEDCAPPFDPRNRVKPPSLTDPMLCEVGGLGLYLAVSSVDELGYTREHGRNRTELVMRRTPLLEDGGRDGRNHRDCHC